MTDLALRLFVFGALWFVVVWCLFGVWTWWERERLWRQIGRR